MCCRSANRLTTLDLYTVTDGIYSPHSSALRQLWHWLGFCWRRVRRVTPHYWGPLAEDQCNITPPLQASSHCNNTLQDPLTLIVLVHHEDAADHQGAACSRFCAEKSSGRVLSCAELNQDRTTWNPGWYPGGTQAQNSMSSLGTGAAVQGMTLPYQQR